MRSSCPDYDVSEERLMLRVTALCDTRPVPDTHVGPAWAHSAGGGSGTDA